MESQRRVVSAEPENSETPLERAGSWVTANRLFFVRNHFDVPRLDVNAWRLSVGGLVRQPAEWTWQELAAMPQRSVFASRGHPSGRSKLWPPVWPIQTET